MQIVIRSVADLVEVPKQKKYKAAYLNEEQIKDMFKALKDSNIYIPVLLAVGLGLRRGEALGLQWNDVDFEKQTINIVRIILYADNQVISHEPKTETSKRVIVAPSSIMAELKGHREKQNETKKIMGEVYQGNNLVSCYDDGHPYNPTTFSGLFAKALEKHKLQHIRFHDLRHTNATVILKHNIPAKVASERLGHATIGITLDLYSHVLKEMQEEAANKFDSALFG